MGGVHNLLKVGDGRAFAMSQRTVERIIGRLATDEELRIRVHPGSERTLLKPLRAQGWELESCRSRCINEYGHRAVVRGRRAH